MKTGLKYLCFTFIALLAKVSTAQVGNCDSLEVLDFQLNPFNAEQLVLRSAYSDFDNFISYPGFSVVDENLFIMAQEEVNYFGMSTEQVHILDVLDMEITEGDAISGDLELWSFFYEYLECVLPGPFVLWPEQECVPLRLTFNSFEPDSAEGIVSWHIVDMDGDTLENQSFALDTLPGLYHFDFCLEAGCGYTLNLETTDFAEAGISYTLHYSAFLAVGAVGTFTETGEDSHSFDLYSCLTTDLSDKSLAQFTVYPNPATDRISVRFVNAGPEHSLRINDLTGRELVHIENTREQLLSIDCSHWPSGIYLISVEQEQKEASIQKLVIAR